MCVTSAYQQTAEPPPQKKADEDLKIIKINCSQNPIYRQINYLPRNSVKRFFFQFTGLKFK